ncbi:hypothetical protein [Burkholderia diffusa]|nr:hypothetical protein [Burkholderia diffusa]
MFDRIARRVAPYARSPASSGYARTIARPLVECIVLLVIFNWIISS